MGITALYVRVVVLVTMALTIASLNINGFLSGDRQNLCAEFMRLNNYDVLFLQETHFTDTKQVREIEKLFEAKIYFSFGQSNSCGVGIIIRDKSDIEYISHRFDTQGRIVSVDVCLGEKEFRLISLYAPNNSRERRTFLEKEVKSFLGGKRDIIMGGDFNFVEDVVLDKAGGNPAQGATGKYEIMDLCNTYDLKEVFRKLKPTFKEFSYFDSQFNVYTRLDRFYISQVLLPHIVGSDYIPCSFSDHSCVTLKGCFQNLAEAKGRGYWKCNVSVLDDVVFQKALTRLWEGELRYDDVYDGDWWEGCKVKFKELIIEHSKRLSAGHRKQLNMLQASLRSIHVKERNNPGMYKQNIQVLEQNINNLLQKSAEGTRVRSRVQYYEENDNPSGLYIRAEQIRARDKCIQVLEDKDGEVSDANSLKRVCHDFYKDLYTREDIDVEQARPFLDSVPKLPEECINLCEGFITYEEYWEAIKGMANNKSPGLDGLPKEFYLKFFPLFGSCFVEMVNWCYVLGELPESQRLGIITLICKDKNRKKNLKAWRPISLLNVDYKIVSKALCNRLKRVIGEVISPDQTCGVPGRSIIDNCHLYRNVVDYVDSRNMECAFLSLDQEKAFDRVSHDYMFSLLEAYGFGPYFIGWIKLLYNNAKSKVLVNGFQTESFDIERSVRQGCSLSPLLYVLCIEPFSIALRADPQVIGLRCPGSTDTVKVVQYADDTTVVVTTEDSVARVMTISGRFSRASGSKINREKCKGLFLGRWKYRALTEMVGVSFSAEPLRLLGVHLASLLETELFNRKQGVVHNRHKANWTVIIDKLESVLKLWSAKSLSYHGKVKVISVIGLSKLWYVGQVLNLPPVFLKSVEKCVYSFFWGGGVEYIKRKALIAPLLEGGMGFVDVECKLKAFNVTHIYKLLSKDFDHKWKSFALVWLKYPLRYHLGNRAVMPPIYTPLFYRKCMTAFNEYNSHVSEGPTENSVPLVRVVYSVLVEQKIEKASIQAKRPLVPFKDVWKNVNNKYLPTELKTVAYRTAHEILPTSLLWFVRYGGRGRRSCVFCPNDEDVNHILFCCPVISPLWRIVKEIFTSALKVNVVLDSNAIVFSLFPTVKGRKLGICLFIVNAVKRCIWHKRCQKALDGVEVTVHTIWRSIEMYLNFKYKVDRIRLRPAKFEAFWFWFDKYNMMNVDGFL